VLNNICHPLSYRFEVIADYFLKFVHEHCVFELPFGGLRLFEKRVVDFLLVLTELFSLGVTAEALRVNID